MAHKLRNKDFRNLGITSDQVISLFINILNKHYKYHSKKQKLIIAERVYAKPEEYLAHDVLAQVALILVEPDQNNEVIEVLKENHVEMNVYGRPLIKSNAYQQMKTATKLPIARKAALMPDSHLGYGLPIGGVLAAENSVIPYAVGMDIGCRMSLSLYPINERYLKMHEHKFKQSLIDNTAFGLSKTLNRYNEHEILERDSFKDTPFLNRLKGKAAKQLGSSGSGNHFVEWGLVELNQDHVLNIPNGIYVGLLAHSGSRGLGASIARQYSDLAKDSSTLPYNMRHLSWLDIESENGQEYWHAMNLAGDYAKACHDVIHSNVSKALGLKQILKIENHHNFAWKEIIDGKELIVHRKGATPAHKNDLGIIPGSMSEAGYIVRGKGNPDSIYSASHGAGRKQSRTETKSKYTNSAFKKHLREQRITLIGGALDESPFAYKKLTQVMSFQTELVEVLGTFSPKIVRMDRAK